jgi:hypothetical protein
MPTEGDELDMNTSNEEACWDGLFVICAPYRNDLESIDALQQTSRDMLSVTTGQDLPSIWFGRSGVGIGLLCYLRVVVGIGDEPIFLGLF